MRSKILFYLFDCHHTDNEVRWIKWDNDFQKWPENIFQCNFYFGLRNFLVNHGYRSICW